MSADKKLVVLVNGSPKLKPEESASEVLLRLSMSNLDTQEFDFHTINVRNSLKNSKTEEDFRIMLQADAILFAFPLYIFCAPGILMRFLQDFHQFWKLRQGYQNKVKIYTIVNCGFPEAFINEEAVRVIQSFSRQTGAEFGFGIMVGSGGMLLGSLDTPFMKQMKEELTQAFLRMKDGILLNKMNSGELMSTEAEIPRKLYYFMAHRGWYSQARRNGLKKKELYRTPYLKTQK